MENATSNHLHFWIMKWYLGFFDKVKLTEVIFLSNLKKKDTFTKKIEGIRLKIRVVVETGDDEEDDDQSQVEIVKILSIPTPFKVS